MQNIHKKSALAQSIRAQAATFLIATSLSLCMFPVTHAQTPLPATEPSLPYTVKAKDKLIVLSQQVLNNPLDWPEVARFNSLKNPNAIAPGQVINIPTRLMKSQPVEGKVISTYGDVKLAGNAAAVGNAIGEGSKLQTGANSSAVVELADGSRITLLPNTLAELVTSRNYAGRDAASSGSTNLFSGLIRLAQGALDTLASKTARRATPLQVETPTSLIGVRGTQFRVAYDDPVSKNARTEVIEGLVRADNPAQNVGADLPQGKGAVINAASKDIKVADLLKAPDLSAISADILKPLALWPMPTLEGAKSYRVQIAIDDTFSKIVRDLVVTNGRADLANLPNGGWFARVRGIDANGLEGYDSAKAVQVVLPPPPFVPPTQWRINADRLDVVNGRHILQFSQDGLDGSHTINAKVSLNQPPATPLAEAKAKGDTARITLDLGYLAPGEQLRLSLTVTQADGAKVIPLTYIFTSLSGWSWSDGPLVEQK
ncbi:MAG: FecR domain-containing protein [Polaromonas sp.]